MESKKIKINFITLIRYLYPITIVLIVITLAFLIKFLYSNVYQTIIQAELITDLKKVISEEILKREKFDKVIENIENKEIKTKINIESLRDPFQSTNQQSQ